MVGFFIGLLAYLFAAIAAWLFFYLVRLIQEQRRIERGQTLLKQWTTLKDKPVVDPPPRTNFIPSTSQGTQPSGLVPPDKKVVSFHLERQLLQLLNGDVQTARRLIEQVHSSNSDKTLDWCAQKVIWDLERDRY